MIQEEVYIKNKNLFFKGEIFIKENNIPFKNILPNPLGTMITIINGLKANINLI